MSTRAPFNWATTEDTPHVPVELAPYPPLSCGVISVPATQTPIEISVASGQLVGDNCGIMFRVNTGDVYLKFSASGDAPVGGSGCWRLDANDGPWMPPFYGVTRVSAIVVTSGTAINLRWMEFGGAQ